MLDLGMSSQYGLILALVLRFGVGVAGGYIYVKELRIVLLAVDNRFTHFCFCVGHKESKLSGMYYIVK